MDAQLIAFTGVAAGMVAMPGADFTVVVRNALTSRRAGLACALGVAGGLLLHTLLAVAGVAAVLAAVPALFRALQLLGGGYVLYLGARTLWSLRRTRVPAAEATGTRRTRAVAAEAVGTRRTRAVAAEAIGTRRTRAVAAEATGTASSAARPLRQGFVTNALNPKAPITFLSLLPQFVPAGSPALPRTLVLALIVVVLALLWFPAVALLVDRLGRWLREPRAARAVETVTGAALTLLGVLLLLEPLRAA
ncbi:threonine/homoserine/homoserine lactone efflux protein [Streptomyces africanus]|uniref:Threonine/homoserine/homoserine lactone efflux protein n=1 Tax=Streptomyces africanus TaxID=231024 RepID=A0ABU0QHL9_9ACTN|nr:LysE family translocator [Streptomyces africanus]MDQ0746871.1 threonine/homoserine/homoserine lactone efflux protein [Streptomyces africanus]